MTGFSVSKVKHVNSGSPLPFWIWAVLAVVIPEMHENLIGEIRKGIKSMLDLLLAFVHKLSR